MSRLSSVVVVVALAALVPVLVACSGPPSGEFDIVAPDRSQFPLVGEAMGRSCGTLDCHGQPGRNMRVWSQYGMRASVHDVPGGAPTTRIEYDLTYRSVVGLEPEAMSQVVKDGGRDPDRLTMIRKARGLESHKGRKLMSVGDPLDLCLTSWLAGEVDTSGNGPCSQVAPPLR